MRDDNTKHLKMTNKCAAWRLISTGKREHERENRRMKVKERERDGCRYAAAADDEVERWLILWSTARLGHINSANTREIIPRRLNELTAKNRNTKEARRWTTVSRYVKRMKWKRMKWKKTSEKERKKRNANEERHKCTGHRKIRSAHICGCDKRHRAESTQNVHDVQRARFRTYIKN